MEGSGAACLHRTRIGVGQGNLDGAGAVACHAQ